jgi:hypothetical protein
MIISLSVALICLNCLGMIPEPYRPGTSSNSMVMANQLVTPPAKPNSPKARMYLVHEGGRASPMHCIISACMPVEGHQPRRCDPKTPPAHLPAMLSSHEESLENRIAMPAAITAKVNTLLMLPFSKNPGSACRVKPRAA